MKTQKTKEQINKEERVSVILDRIFELNLESRNVNEKMMIDIINEHHDLIDELHKIEESICK